MLTARQVAGMVGPEGADCDCDACLLVVRAKELICEPITKLDEEDQCLKDKGDPPSSVWLAVVVIATGRLRAQGAPPKVVMEAMMHGAEQAEEQNPLLCRKALGSGVPS